MNLRDYQWFNNPRGLHNSGPFRPFDLKRYTAPYMGWAKLVAGGDEYVGDAARLAAARCMPIVRIHRTDMGAMAVPDDWYPIYQSYIDAGCRWFELYDEPNTDSSWPQTPDRQPVVDLTWENRRGCIQPLMDNWLDWAERIIDMGAYPGFPALAESGDPRRATVYWLNAFMSYLVEARYDRFVAIISNGLWCATHPYLLNHFYQEPPGGPPHIARPYYQQSADEAGWHFEYPYDPIMQRHDPGRTVFGPTAAVPYGDPQGLVATGEAFQQFIQHYFGGGPVPVIGTAGGITPLPRSDEDTIQPDPLYPPYSRASHAEATLAMWHWIANEGPPWFFGLALWNEAAYYDAQGIIPAVERMAAALPVLKILPAIGTGVPPVVSPETPAAPVIEEPEVLEIFVPSEPAPAETGLPDEWAYSTPPVEPQAADLADDQIKPPQPLVSGPVDAAAGAEPPAGDGADDLIEPPQPLAGRLADDVIEILPLGYALPEDDDAAPPPGESEVPSLPPDEPPADEAPADLEDELPAVAYDNISWLPEDGDLFGEVRVVEEPDWSWLEEDENEEGERPPAAPAPPAWDEEDELSDDEDGDWLEGRVIDASAVPLPAEPVDGSVESPVESDDLPEWLREEAAGAASESPPPTGRRPAAKESSESGTVIPLPARLVRSLPGPSWMSGPAEPPAPARPPGETPSPEPFPAAQESADVPRHHWMLIAPGTNPLCLAQAGERYWHAFRPMLITDWEALSLAPDSDDLAVTVLADSQHSQEAEQRIKSARPRARIDLVLCDSVEELAARLNWRADTGRPLG